MLLPELLRVLTHTRPCLQYGQWQVLGVELLAAAQRLRTSLVSLGVSSGERVAFILPNHPALPVVWLATLSLRGVAVPLHPGLTPVELETFIRAARPKVLVGLAPFMRSARDVCVRLGVEAPRLLRLESEVLDESLHRIQREHHARLLDLDRVLALGLEDEGVHPLFGVSSEGVSSEGVSSEGVSSEEVERLETFPVQVDTPAVLLFTSGTTGAPKGAVLSHGNLGSNGTAIARDWFGGLGWEREGVGPKVLAVLPLCHNFGLNVTLDATWLAGGVSVILPRFSAVEVARAMGQAEVAVLSLVPTMTQALLPRLEAEPRLVRSLRLLVSGGAALPGVLRERVKGLWPWVELRDTYGLTETSLLATTGPGRAHPGSVGGPIEHTELRIVSERGGLCEVGEVGEVQ
ncbi:MAG: AMP-binding protein, partial [Myxococcota bacterium]